MSTIPLKYKDRREEGDTVLRQCQLVQLHLLHVVDAICKQHKLTYVLDGGSLLGAMRHNGFIPWDDDLDIGMPRKDYNRFLEIARRELPKDVIMLTPEDTPERVIGFTKLKDAYSFYAELSLGVSIKRNSGIFIDIFPYDTISGLPNDLEHPFVMFAKKMYHYARALQNSGSRGWLFALFGGWLSLIPYTIHYTIRLCFWLLGFVTKRRMNYYCWQFPFRTSYPISALLPVKEHVFEDGVFPIPNDADFVLTRMFGDWRKLPPEAERHGGHGKLILPFQAVMVPGAMKWEE